MAERMGIKLMLPDHYNILQEKDQFDPGTLSWLLTHSDVRSTGIALSGISGDVGVYVIQRDARDHCHGVAWRGSLGVKKVTA